MLCIKGAEGCRSAFGRHEALRRIIADVPDLAFKLVGDILEQSRQKMQGKDE